MTKLKKQLLRQVLDGVEGDVLKEDDEDDVGKRGDTRQRRWRWQEREIERGRWEKRRVCIDRTRGVDTLAGTSPDDRRIAMTPSLDSWRAGGLSRYPFGARLEIFALRAVAFFFQRTACLSSDCARGRVSCVKSMSWTVLICGYSWFSVIHGLLYQNQLFKLF